MTRNQPTGYVPLSCHSQPNEAQVALKIWQAGYVELTTHKLGIDLRREVK